LAFSHLYFGVLGVSFRPTEYTVRQLLIEVVKFNDILDFLYPALANEIEQLKALMKG